MAKVPEHKHYKQAFDNYFPSLVDLVGKYEAPNILELGGGRRPSYALADLPANVRSYTVNDIDPDELALVPEGYQTAVFDVTADVSRFAGQYDVIFSRTLMEHVSDGKAMHRNVLALLKPGGVAFHMGPTLYAPPFVLNRLLPERLSRAVLVKFRPWRRTERPKFPAFYSWCFGNKAKMTRMLREVGYREVEIRTFYGHGYYKPFPVIRQLSAAVTAIAARRNWTVLASFVHVIARK